MCEWVSDLMKNSINNSLVFLLNIKSDGEDLSFVLCSLGFNGTIKSYSENLYNNILIENSYFFQNYKIYEKKLGFLK